MAANPTASICLELLKCFLAQSYSFEWPCACSVMTALSLEPDLEGEDEPAEAPSAVDPEPSTPKKAQKEERQGVPVPDQARRIPMPTPTKAAPRSAGRVPK